jgi:hypothetical protein
LCQFSSWLLLAWGTAAAGACVPCCGVGPAGDPSQPAQLQLTAGAITPTGQISYAPVVDGGSVRLVRGGQGLLMVAMNVLANNVEACNVTLSGQLFEPSGAQDVANQVVRNLSPGTGGASISGDFGHVVTLPPSLPGYGLWTLSGQVQDPTQHGTSASVSFQMECDPQDTFCACTILKPPMPQCDGGH